MKFEVRGETDKLRNLQRALDSKFKCVEYETVLMEILIIKVYAASPDCERVKDFIEAFCQGAGITWSGRSF
jgi:hypothetical protein